MNVSIGGAPIFTHVQCSVCHERVCLGFLIANGSTVCTNPSACHHNLSTTRLRVHDDPEVIPISSPQATFEAVFRFTAPSDRVRCVIVVPGQPLVNFNDALLVAIDKRLMRAPCVAVAEKFMVPRKGGPKRPFGLSPDPMAAWRSSIEAAVPAEAFPPKTPIVKFL